MTSRASGTIYPSGDLEISPRPPFALTGHPEILVLSNILAANGQPIGKADTSRTWHTHMSSTATPLRSTILYAVEISHNAAGHALGDTLFVSTAAAYEVLSPGMQARLCDLRAIHRASSKRYAEGRNLTRARLSRRDWT